jgi:hypothetical protein
MTERAHRISPILETMIEVTEGAVSVDEPEVIQVLQDATEDDVYQGIPIITVTPEIES